MKDWAAKYAGKFDDGWDAYRERVYGRAKDLGWIPPDAELTERHELMPAWNSIPEEEKLFQRRLMEVAAGFAEHCDVQVGRLLDELDELGYGDHAGVLHLGRQWILWGGPERHHQRAARPERNSHHDRHAHRRPGRTCGLGVLGSPKTENQYHAGWAWAGSTPYKGMKLLASHLGRTRNPLGVRWPAPILGIRPPRRRGPCPG